ncbi:MAG: hypothetical protein KBG54_04775 [Oscillospiraceae bacterium]|nr:hypothetical protein [Oscillospiraceae bacterium]
MENLLILGAGGYGRVIRELAADSGAFADIAFLDDANGQALGKLCEYERFLPQYRFAYAALGNNLLRVDWLRRLLAAGFLLPTFVHPRAYVSPSASIEPGTAVLANATVCAGARIFTGAIINAGAIADHDCILNEGVHLAPGAVVKANCVLERLAKVESGEVVFNI